MLVLSALVLQKDRGESEEEEKSVIGLCDPVVQCFLPSTLYLRSFT